VVDLEHDRDGLVQSVHSPGTGDRVDLPRWPVEVEPPLGDAGQRVAELCFPAVDHVQVDVLGEVDVRDRDEDRHSEVERDTTDPAGQEVRGTQPRPDPSAEGLLGRGRRGSAPDLEQVTRHEHLEAPRLLVEDEARVPGRHPLEAPRHASPHPGLLPLGAPYHGRIS